MLNWDGFGFEVQVYWFCRWINYITVINWIVFQTEIRNIEYIIILMFTNRSLSYLLGYILFCKVYFLGFIFYCNRDYVFTLVYKACCQRFRNFSILENFVLPLNCTNLLLSDSLVKSHACVNLQLVLHFSPLSTLFLTIYSQIQVLLLSFDIKTETIKRLFQIGGFWFLRTLSLFKIKALF